MAKFVAKNPKEVQAALKKIQERNKKMVKSTMTRIPQVLLNSGRIIEARAKEIITEKGHVVTGNLRRSINTQIGEVTATSVEVLVGTWVEYAIYVETLPDGGFLFPAAVESVPTVNKFLVEQGIMPELVDWGRP